LDPRAEELDMPEPLVLIEEDCEFARIDERYTGSKHSHAFPDVMIPSLGTDFAAIAPVMGGGFAPYNALGHYDYNSRKLETYFPGPKHMVQEPVFVPRHSGAKEGDGFLMALVNNYGDMTSELHIIDTANFTKAAAIVNLPIRLRAGLHGNWVDASEIRKD
jgi:carotenoid cleavage dioxygenase-like enzyme